MKLRAKLASGAALCGICLVVFIVVSNAGGSTSPQSGPTASPYLNALKDQDQEAPPIGRYVLVTTAIGGMYLSDTATGDCWRLDKDNLWAHIPRPKAR
jgi:hypothetical protein